MQFALVLLNDHDFLADNTVWKRLKAEFTHVHIYVKRRLCMESCMDNLQTDNQEFTVHFLYSVF
jgi:hypothetical protein